MTRVLSPYLCGTYTLHDVQCRNCHEHVGTRGPGPKRGLEIPKGQALENVRCPVCGCKALVLR